MKVVINRYSGRGFRLAAISLSVFFFHCRLKNLPYSFTKLSQMTAMWLSENQVRLPVLCIKLIWKSFYAIVADCMWQKLLTLDLPRSIKSVYRRYIDETHHCERFLCSNIFVLFYRTGRLLLTSEGSWADVRNTVPHCPLLCLCLVSVQMSDLVLLFTMVTNLWHGGPWSENVTSRNQDVDIIFG